MLLNVVIRGRDVSGLRQEGIQHRHKRSLPLSQKTKSMFTFECRVLRVLSVNGIFTLMERQKKMKRTRKYCFVAHQQYFCLTVRVCRESTLRTLFPLFYVVIGRLTVIAIRNLLCLALYYLWCFQNEEYSCHVLFHHAFVIAAFCRLSVINISIRVLFCDGISVYHGYVCSC